MRLIDRRTRPARQGVARLAGVLLERRRPKLLSSAVRLTPARREQGHAEQTPAVVTAPPGMSEFAASWIFGDGPAEGLPFAAAPALTAEPGGERSRPSFLAEPPATPAHPPASRPARVGRPLVEEFGPYRLSASPAPRPASRPSPPGADLPEPVQPPFAESSVVPGDEPPAQEPAVELKPAAPEAPRVEPQAEVRETFAGVPATSPPAAEEASEVPAPRPDPEPADTAHALTSAAREPAIPAEPGPPVRMRLARSSRAPARAAVRPVVQPVVRPVPPQRGAPTAAEGTPGGQPPEPSLDRAAGKPSTPHRRPGPVGRLLARAMRGTHWGAQAATPPPQPVRAAEEPEGVEPVPPARMVVVAREFNFPPATQEVGSALATERLSQTPAALPAHESEPESPGWAGPVSASDDPGAGPPVAREAGPTAGAAGRPSIPPSLPAVPLARTAVPGRPTVVLHRQRAARAEKPSPVRSSEHAWSSAGRTFSAAEPAVGQAVLGGTSGVSLAQAAGTTASHEGGTSTVLFRAAAEPAPAAAPESEVAPHAGPDTTGAPHHAHPAAATAPAGAGADDDELYERVIDRLRRELMTERERMGDLLGDLP
jgi:hypothetical protein